MRRCRINKQSPKITSLHPWEFPEGPWKHIHLDFAGPIEEKQLMVMVEAYSKWPEVAIMEETTTDHILREIGNTFARWGIPLQVVTDNGPQFISQQFEQFMKANNCTHTRTSPYHPATNGLAERFVQSLKQAIRASRKEKSLAHRVANFLLHYRNVRHSTTEASPAQLMIGRDLRSRLHLLRPDLRGCVLKHQAIQVNSRASAPE